MSADSGVGWDGFVEERMNELIHGILLGIGISVFISVNAYLVGYYFSCGKNTFHKKHPIVFNMVHTNPIVITTKED